MAIDGYVKAVCITRTFAYCFWPSRNISDKCEDKILDEGTNFFRSDPSFITRFCTSVTSHKNANIALYQNWLYIFNPVRINMPSSNQMELSEQHIFTVVFTPGNTNISSLYVVWPTYDVKTGSSSKRTFPSIALYNKLRDISLKLCRCLNASTVFSLSA
jgi:hypothetical protein